jgi:hypothetical protein
MGFLFHRYLLAIDQAKISANAASAAWSIGGGAGGASPGGKNSSSGTLAVRMVLPPNCLHPNNA